MPNPALDSWYGDSWRLGGGAVWGWFSYDAELNYFYYGTGNCGPWNPDYRREWGVINLDEHGGLASYRNGIVRLRARVTEWADEQPGTQLSRLPFSP
jgi:glucose dehydrogenase